MKRFRFWQTDSLDDIDDDLETPEDPSTNTQKDALSSNDAFIRDLIRHCTRDCEGLTLSASGIWKPKRLLVSKDRLYLIARKANDNTKLELVESIPLHEVISVLQADTVPLTASLKDTSTSGKFSVHRQSSNASVSVHPQSSNASVVLATSSVDNNEASDYPIQADENDDNDNRTGVVNHASIRHKRALCRTFSSRALKNMGRIATSLEMRSALEIRTVEGGYNEGQVPYSRIGRCRL